MQAQRYRIREAATARGLGLRQVADRAGVHQRHVYRLASARGCRNTSMGMLRRIAAAIGCPLRELFVPEDLEGAA